MDRECQRPRWKLDYQRRISHLMSRLPRLVVCLSNRPRTVLCTSQLSLLERSSKKAVDRIDALETQVVVRRAPKNFASAAEASTSVGPAVDLTVATPPRPSIPASVGVSIPTKGTLRSNTPSGSPLKNVSTSAVASPGREGSATAMRSQTPPSASCTS